MLVKQVTIQRSHSGFGMYQAGGIDSEVYDLADILNELGENTYQLGKDALPDGIEDIRGKVYNEPDVIYVSESGNYYGFNFA